MNTKEVDFARYCSFCEHVNENENEMPCDECLEHGNNEDSKKPIYFKEKEK